MTTTITKTRPAFLGDAAEDTIIRFSIVRTITDGDGETHVVREAGEPVYDKFHGTVTAFRRIKSLPYPTIEYSIEGSDRVFTARPDFRIEIDEEVPVHAALAHITETSHRWSSGTCSAADAADALLAAAALLKALDMRAFPMGTLSDERLEQVLITVHGIEFSTRGRTGDVYVDVTDLRDDDERDKNPLILAVDEDEIYQTP